MTEPARRRRPLARSAVPATCGGLAVGLLVAATLLHAADPTAVLGMPGFDDPTWWWAAAVVGAQAVALAVRPRATPGVLVAVGAAVPALAVLGEGIGIALFAVLVAAFETAVEGPRPRRWPALATVGVLVAAGVATSELRIGTAAPAAVVGGLMQALGTVGLPVLAAAVVGSRREARAARADTLAARTREHDALVQVAVERERTAMARELHDIAAHHLSGIAVMTGAIGRQIDVDPAGAKIAVAQVREQSTAMLRDLRNLVVLLRDTDAPGDAGGTGGTGGTVRMETLAGVAELVDRARESGLDVTLERSGPVDELAATGSLGPLAQLVVYRTVQEGLANASRHAPGARCEVLLDAGDGSALVVTVRNGPPPDRTDPPPHEPGYGLVGMRERAEVTGATLRHGPRVDGGWQLRLTVPAAERTPTGQTPTARTPTEGGTTP
ncbi:histidine kinase [Cellulomonas cellasea]|uniref:histidine kinase n=1 Tax=Cellulomonas cellasea TaxID=43670 RepID=A0A7W4UG42_9CELL|nr:histidine kinase [Cellulomonas cellasea]MBB2923548.1 signal transduction histidine kinase [Cellulomonas cellasea]